MSVQVSTGFAEAILGPASFDGLFRDSVIEVLSGAQPANADLAPTGIVLGYITRNGGAFSHGSPTNGLRWLRAGRLAYKTPNHQWMLRGVAAGTAGWCRLLRNSGDSRALSLADIRIDGRVGLQGQVDTQLVLESLAITDTTLIDIPNLFFGIPPLS